MSAFRGKSQPSLLGGGGRRIDLRQYVAAPPTADFVTAAASPSAKIVLDLSMTILYTWDYKKGIIMKIKDIIVFHKEKIIDDGEVILLDQNNTFWNIRLWIEEKYPNIPIEIVNEGMGER